MGDPLDQDRGGWTEVNEAGAAAAYSSGGFLITPVPETGWYGDTNNGFYRFKRIPGDFRVRVTLRVDQLNPAVVLDFSNAGILVYPPAGCAAPGREDEWLLLDHGYQGAVPEAGFTMPFLGGLWKQNIWTDAGYVTTREVVTADSTQVTLAVCRRGNQMDACISGTPWRCGQTRNLLQNLAELEVGLTAGQFQPGDGGIQALFSAFVVDEPPPGTNPCSEGL